MSRAGNDTGLRVVELDAETLEFAIENCDANLRLATGILQNMIDDEKNDRRGSEKVVALMEKFKTLKAALEKAR